MKVEVQRLEAGFGGRRDERILAEALVRLHLAYIQEPGRSDGSCLQIFEDGVRIGDAEDDLVQVGQPCAGAVVAGVAHQRVVIPRHALSHHKGAAGDLWVQVVGRLLDGLGRHPAKMVRGQRGEAAIHPQREERRIGSREVEGDRKVVRRDVC